MNADRTSRLAQRAAVHAALSDPARLQIVDTLQYGDAAPSELAAMLAMPSNLMAHHLRALEDVGLITRRRSEGDRRRTYLQLVPAVLDTVSLPSIQTPQRVVFVCTANSARSHLAAALWRRSSTVPAESAGTHPAKRIEPAALEAAARHALPIRRLRPRHLSQVQDDGDLIVTVCDVAHEELGTASRVHWSIPDPVRVGTAKSYDQTVDELARRVDQLAPRLANTSSESHSSA